MEKKGGSSDTSLLFFLNPSGVCICIKGEGNTIQ